MQPALEWAVTARSHASDCASSTRVSHCSRKSQPQSAGRVCTNDSAATHRTFCGQYVAVARRYALCTNTHCSSNSAAALSRLSVRVRFLAGATVMEVVRAAHAFTQTSLRGALPLTVQAETVMRRQLVRAIASSGKLQTDTGGARLDSVQAHRSGRPAHVRLRCLVRSCPDVSGPGEQKARARSARPSGHNLSSAPAPARSRRHSPNIRHEGASLSLCQELQTAHSGPSQLNFCWSHAAP